MLNKPRRLITFPPAAEQRTVELAGTSVTYTLKRTSRRHSIGLRIDDRGLTVNVPLRASEKWLHSVLQDKARWVVEKMENWQAKKPAPQQWVDGAPILFRGETFTLRIVPSLFDSNFISKVKQGGDERATKTVHLARLGASEEANAVSPMKWNWNDAPPQLHGTYLVVHVSQADNPAAIEKTVERWYRRVALQLFEECVAHFAPLMNVSPREIKLSAARTQWGSCTVRGTVRLNWQLIKMPLRLIDYVVVHELAHLVEMNHSAAFWRVVGKVCPDYVRLRGKLRRWQVA